MSDGEGDAGDGAAAVVMNCAPSQRVTGCTSRQRMRAVRCQSTQHLLLELHVPLLLLQHSLCMSAVDVNRLICPSSLTSHSAPLSRSIHYTVQLPSPQPPIVCLPSYACITALT